MRHLRRIAMLALLVPLGAGGCRTAVVAEPRTEDGEQTVVTVEERPKSSSDDKDITIIDKRE